MDEIVNRVANSPLRTIDLEAFYDETEIVEFDMKEHLFQGLILREKDFRGFIKEHDWDSYQDKHVALHCSADAIVPTWAYMLVSSKLNGKAKTIHFGSSADLQQRLMIDRLHSLDLSEYQDKPIVIKGCSKFEVPIGVYTEATKLLTPIAKSIMYGEPCSTVPIYKKPR